MDLILSKMDIRNNEGLLEDGKFWIYRIIKY